MMGLRRLVQALRSVEAQLAEEGSCPPTAAAHLAELWQEAVQALAADANQRDGAAGE